MSIQHLVAAFLVLALTAGCATTSSRPVRSEFEDIPVPKGLSYQPSKSTIIESPTVKAARLVYRGRLEVDSLSVAMRTTLEANAWMTRNSSGLPATSASVFCISSSCPDKKYAMRLIPV